MSVMYEVVENMKNKLREAHKNAKGNIVFKKKIQEDMAEIIKRIDEHTNKMWREDIRYNERKTRLNLLKNSLESYIDQMDIDIERKSELKRIIRLRVEYAIKELERRERKVAKGTVRF